MDFIQQHQTQNLTDARNGAQLVERIGIVLLGRFENGQFHIAEQAVVVVNEREIDFDALLHRRIGKPLGDAVAVRLVGNLLANLGQVVLTIGILDVPEQLRALAHQVHPAPEQVTGGAHRCRRDRGLRDHPAAEQHGDFPGVNPVVFRFAAMDGFHRQGMAEDKRQSVLRTQVGEPVPRKEALHGDDNILSIGGNDLQKRLWACLHIAMHQDLTVVVENTDVHGAGMEVDATVKLVLLGVEAHEVSSSP
jgi:hypothetical protein